MRQIGRHINQITRFGLSRYSGQREFAFTGQDLNERMLGRNVLSEFLPLGKSKQHGPGISGPEDSPAGDAVRHKSRFIRQRQHCLLFRIN